MMFILIFLFGLIIGSFLNVVAFRHNTGRSVSGRSGCLSCGKTLGPLELVPVLSFLIQQGRCRSCGVKLSWQYPLVELSTAMLFALIYWRLGWQIESLIIFWLAVCALMVITVYDFKHKIIPDRFVFFFVLLGLVLPLAESWREPSLLLWRLGGAVLGGLLTALPLLLLWVVSRGRWLGFGDVKLAFGIGLLLGVVGGLSALILSFWIGAGVGLLLIAWGKLRLWRRRKSYTMKSEIPFAPFLILGFWLVFLFSINVLVFWQI